MKKNRFIGLTGIFFLLISLGSGIIVSCKEKDEDIVKPKTITDIILENNQFSILREIMFYAEMTDALRTDELTFFAPSNDAFGKANIFSATVITSLPADSARHFIKSHIIGKKKLMFSELAAGQEKALSGHTLTITKTDSNIAVNKSDIVIKDLNADNGVIHVIDSLAVEF
jgi:uncharacterized surface protein with fasciclin (FAS1) repeats